MLRPTAVVDQRGSSMGYRYERFPRGGGSWHFRAAPLWALCPPRGPDRGSPIARRRVANPAAPVLQVKLLWSQAECVLEHIGDVTG